MNIGLGEWLLIVAQFLLPAIWVWRDTRVTSVPGGRTWVAIVLFTGVLGLVAYLLVRRWSKGRASRNRF